MSTLIYPQLDGVKINKDLTLPVALIQAIRKAYDYISQVGSVSGTAAVIEDLRANRNILYPPATYALGSLYYETDTSLTYINKLVNSANSWAYLSGVYKRTQSQLSGLASGLTASDNLLLVSVTDYAHVLQWANPAWGWGPGEQGSGQMVMFEVDPTGAGWHLYDGSTVAYLKANGSTSNVTLPDLVSTAAYLKPGSPNSGPTAATAPTVTNPATTGVGNAVIGFPSSTNNANNGSFAAFGFATNTHIHSDSGHSHSISAPTVGTDGQPRNLVRRPWFRQ